MLQHAYVLQMRQHLVSHCRLAIELSGEPKGMEHEQQTIGWDDTLSQVVFRIVDLEDKGRQGLISGFFPQFRCRSQAITRLGALEEGTRFHKTELY